MKLISLWMNKLRLAKIIKYNLMIMALDYTIHSLFDYENFMSWWTQGLYLVFTVKKLGYNTDWKYFGAPLSLWKQKHHIEKTQWTETLTENTVLRPCSIQMENGSFHNETPCWNGEKQKLMEAELDRTRLPNRSWVQSKLVSVIRT